MGLYRCIRVHKRNHERVATDSKGEYKLVLAPQKNLVLMYSFVGMKMKEVPVSKPGVVNVVLEDDVSDLDEVRVIAYGKTTKREMTGAMTSIKGEVLSAFRLQIFPVYCRGVLPG